MKPIATVVMRTKQQPAFRMSASALIVSAFHALAAHIAVLDRDAGVADRRSAWTVRYANERMRRLGGRAAVRGSVTFDALVRLADAQDLFVALDEAHTIGAPSRWQGCEPQEDGQALWLEADLVPLEGEAGAPPPMLVVMRNITERKRVEERLVSQAELLERRNAELRDFAWTASHDLRAPLRKIRAFIERLTEMTDVVRYAPGDVVLDPVVLAVPDDEELLTRVSDRIGALLGVG
jgi:signal transduction histidine kinase